MKTRREFLVMAAGAGVALKLWAPVFASGTGGSLSISTSIAVTQVFGDGIRLTDIAVQYSQPVDGRKLNLADFTVEGRTVTDVFTSRSANPADKGTAGEYVIIALSPKDKNAVLAEKLTAKKNG